MDDQPKHLIIAKLNDLLRKQRIGGQVMVTMGVQTSRLANSINSSPRSPRLMTSVSLATTHTANMILAKLTLVVSVTFGKSTTTTDVFAWHHPTQLTQRSPNAS